MAEGHETPSVLADNAWTREAARNVRRGFNGVRADDGLPIRFWGDLGTVAPPDRLVRRLLGTATLALIYGEPGSGKTFLATDLGMHIALGWAWFGRPVTIGAVLYVACEGIAGISNRLAAFRRRHNLPDEVPIAIVPAAVNLGPDGHDAQRVIAAVSSVEARTGQMVQLVVLDTLARALGTGDENSAQHMGAFIAACDQIRVETGCTVLVVHHRGKSQQSGARGSSALLCAVDTAIEVEKRGANRLARVVKQKDGAEGDELGFALEVVEIGTDDEGEPITTCIMARDDEAGAPALPRQRDPTGNTGVVFKALQRALADGGEDAPSSSHIPQSVRVVSPDRWRNYAYKIMSEATPDARQKAFKRGYDSLIRAGHVCVWGNNVWIT